MRTYVSETTYSYQQVVNLVANVGEILEYGTDVHVPVVDVVYDVVWTGEDSTIVFDVSKKLGYYTNTTRYVPGIIRAYENKFKHISVVATDEHYDDIKVFEPMTTIVDIRSPEWRQALLSAFDTCASLTQKQLAQVLIFTTGMSRQTALRKLEQAEKEGLVQRVDSHYIRKNDGGESENEKNR